MNFSRSDFFALFPYDTFTLQTFVAGRPKEVVRVPRENLEEYLATQQAPTEVFFMVNEGDGQVYGNNKTCRSQAAVTTLNACFIDTDSCPLENVKAYIKQRGLKPHAVIETSPGKFHFYFMIEPCSKVALRVWQEIQLSLCYFSNPNRTPTGCDPSMKDHSRVLRVPGFVHQKSGFTTRIALLSNHATYDIAELAKIVGVNQSQTEPQPSVQYQLPTEETPAGSRHYDMASFLAHLLNRDVDTDVALHAFYGHAKLNYENGEDFLPGGKRNSEVLKFIEYREQKTKEERVKLAERVLDESDLLRDGASSRTDKFALPDSFYFELPGLAGDIVREIDQKAYIKNPPFTWAATIAALGSLKALYTETTLGHAPANYFLCLAPTGTGKNYAIETFQNTFTKLGMTNFLQSKLRSDQGLLRFLSENQGTGLILADEAEYFLSMLDNKNAPVYIRNCKAMLLELYTSTHKTGVSYGFIGDRRQQPVILNRPRLNYVGYGVVNALENCFSEASIQDGLLQRFIVITDFRNIEKNPTYKPVSPLNGTCFSGLTDLHWKLKLKKEGNLIALQELKSSMESEPDPQRRAAMLADLRKHAAWVQGGSKVLIPFTPEAKTNYESFAASLMKQRNAAKNQVTSGLYTRAAEQVGRLAAAIATDSIDATLIDYLITFVTSRITALKDYCSENLDAVRPRGQNLHRDLTELRQAVARIQADNAGQPVTYRNIARRYKVRNAQELKTLLEAACSAELITIHDNYRKGESGRKGTAYSVAAD